MNEPRAEGDAVRVVGAVPQNVPESLSVTAAFESVDRRIAAFKAEHCQPGQHTFEGEYPNGVCSKCGTPVIDL